MRTTFILTGVLLLFASPGALHAQSAPAAIPGMDGCMCQANKCAYSQFNTSKCGYWQGMCQLGGGGDPCPKPEGATLSFDGTLSGTSQRLASASAASRARLVSRACDGAVVSRAYSDQKVEEIRARTARLSI